MSHEWLGGRRWESDWDAQQGFHLLSTSFRFGDLRLFRFWSKQAVHYLKLPAGWLFRDVKWWNSRKSGSEGNLSGTFLKRQSTSILNPVCIMELPFLRIESLQPVWVETDIKMILAVVVRFVVFDGQSHWCEIGKYFCFCTCEADVKFMKYHYLGNLKVKTWEITRISCAKTSCFSFIPGVVSNLLVSWP